MRCGRWAALRRWMAFRENILVFSQPGALNGGQLEQVIDAVKGLDMEDVRAKVAEQMAAQEAEEAAQRSS